MIKFCPKFKLLFTPVILTLLFLGTQQCSVSLKNSNIEAVPKDRFSSQTYYEVSIPPEKADQYLSADYKLWIPDGLKKISGLILKQHGCGDSTAATGLEHANDLQWQALAKKHQLALLGAKYLMGDKPCEYWALINYGSGKAFLKALHILSQNSAHPELEKAPWVFWGHSGGADWGTQMMQQYPERTVAVVALRGGAFSILGKNPTLTGIPVLFALGDKDVEAINDTQTLPREVFYRYRKMGAPWAIAVEANTGHEVGDTRFLAIPYLDAILKTRLIGQNPRLQPINISQGWLGNPITHEVAPVKYYKAKPLEAAWLPDKHTAQKWREYVVTGKILPTRKPNAPINLKASQLESGDIILTWNFIPDLENGLPSFHIYRNKLLLSTLQAKRHNSGDAPDLPSIALEFQDKDATLNSTYAVSAFNKHGEATSQSVQPIKLK